MEHRGIRYTLRAGIERDHWTVVIHPGDVESVPKIVSGDRERRKRSKNCKRRPRASGSGGPFDDRRLAPTPPVALRGQWRNTFTAGSFPVQSRRIDCARPPSSCFRHGIYGETCCVAGHGVAHFFARSFYHRRVGGLRLLQVRSC